MTYLRRRESNLPQQTEMLCPVARLHSTISSSLVRRSERDCLPPGVDEHHRRRHHSAFGPFFISPAGTLGVTVETFSA